MKKLYVKVTYFSCLKSPIHVVDQFEINRTANFIQPIEEFISVNNLLNNPTVGDKIVIEFLRMTKKEFDALSLTV